MASDAIIDSSALEATVWGDLVDADGDGLSMILEAFFGTHLLFPDEDQSQVVEIDKANNELVLEWRQPL